MLKTILGTCLVLVLVGLGALYLAAQPLASALTSRLVQKAHTELLSSGIENRVQIEGSSISFPGTLNYSGISVAADIPKQQRWGQAWRAILGVDHAAVRIARLRPFTLDLSLKNLVLTLSRTEEKAPDVLESGPVTLYADQANLPIPLSRADFEDPRAAAERIGGEFRQLLKGIPSSLPLQIQGRVFLNVDGQPLELHFRAVKEQGQTRIFLDREDIRRVGDLTEEGLTAAEVEILASHPADAPRLIAIQRYATRVSTEAGRQGSGVPVDAYRHVLWSYLLTRAYGPEFAKTVTDAHEIGENKHHNTPQDHAMDYHNNRIGSDYAMKKLPESQLLEKVLLDPAIIKSTADPRSN